MAPRTPRVLAVGTAGRPNGYGRVIDRVLRGVRARFDVMRFGFDYAGAPRRDDATGVPAVPNRDRAGDPFGVAQLPALLDQARPDVVFLCHDPWLYAMLAPVLRAAARPPRVVFYCPVGHAWSAREDLAALAGVDRLVAYTRFGRDVLRRALGDDRAIAVVPHGVDARVFRPLAGHGATPADLARSRREARATLFPRRPELRDAFVVLSANRNTARKRLDLTLEAFARFARARPDVYLYLHCGMRDVGVDVPAVARALGVADRLLATTDAAGPPDVADARLNVVYNACDVGLHTATAEGWGLTAFEHAATGGVQVAPDHSAFGELWREAGVLVPATPQHTDEAPRSDADAGVIDTAAAALALARLYDDRGELARRARAARAYAADARFDWDRDIGAQWTALFDDVLDRGARPRRAPQINPKGDATR